MKANPLGLFWEDIQGDREAVPRDLSLIPNTGWKAPRDFPNLSSAKVLAFDTETKDLELKTHGPGFCRGAGEVVGVSIATVDKAWYFPISHAVNPEQNLDKQQVLMFLKDALGTNIPKVGANLSYDIGWLHHHGVEVYGELFDVLIAEALLDERAKQYNLGAVSEKYLGEGKITNELYDWCALTYGGSAKDQRKNIWRSPPCLVGPYAEADAYLPLRVIEKQIIELQEAGLYDLFKMENVLTRMLLGMKFRGTPINVPNAEAARTQLMVEEENIQLEINEVFGAEFSLSNKDESYVKLFTKLGLEYPTTAKGNPSFTKSFMQRHAHPTIRRINEAKELNKARTSFVENAILDKQTNGKIYTSFHQLKSDDGGTVSGRFSSSLPNLQQIPSRNKKIARLIRGLFVPEDSFPLWMKMDYSQIEYRAFAGMSQDADLIKSYKDNPNIDYHSLVSSFLNDMLDRPVIKNLNFASLYAAGTDKIMLMLMEYMTKEDAEEILLTAEVEWTPANLFKVLANYVVNLYHTKFPAAKKTLYRIMAQIQRTGEVRTVLNRRTKFDLYEPKNSRGKYPLPYNQAIIAWGMNIQVANTYKGLNYQLQGSAADLLKKGMVDAFEAGIFKRTGYPHLTVHDELDFSFHPDLTNAFMDLRDIMENTLDLGVPVILDVEAGPNWGSVKDYELIRRAV